MEQVLWHLAIGGVVLAYLGNVCLAFLSGQHTSWWEPFAFPLVLPLLLVYQARETVLFLAGLLFALVLGGSLMSVAVDLVSLVWSLV
ncbi:hypothetical protein RCH14_001641 [Massilia sp. MP_M2]|uniref:hypothetical protein n=1 Tax=Massilia sp. MP_M2 TaxID=3071713 RepID=UPI00319DE8BA